jgi:2-polyprenyl-6-methoxyphenol hydroxylase-like FAD-dependent oxidoreductase
VDEKIRDYVQRVAKHRAPWFSAEVKSIAWCTEVVFEHQVAKQFGREQCWLVGDAAHQTGPAGVQSMNVGFLEAEALVEELRKALREGKGSDLDGSYNQPRQAEWKRLLGLEGGLKARKETVPWVGERAGRILPCLTGSGTDLAALAEQLRLDYL